MERLGRYEILEEVGRGAMGIVYRARDPKIDRVVAIKTISVFGVSPDNEEDYRQRIFREAQAAGKLSHPGIVTIYDVGEEQTTDTPYIVMEYIAGQILESLVTGAPTKPLPLGTTLGLVKQIAEALDYAHTQGIIHRDIKPANIIVTAEGRARITDFGIAKLSLTHFTLPGELLGTPSYMSPEQVKGCVVDGRCDLFSLGVILYWLLTGEKPFTGDTPTAVSYKIVYQDPVQASQLNPSLGRDFDYVLDRALAKDPARRYQRGKEFAEDLEDLQQGRAPQSRSSVKSESTIVVDESAEKTIVRKPARTLPIVTPEARLTRPWGRIADFAKRLPREVQIAIAIGVVFLVFFAFRTSEPVQAASLYIKCQHGFRAAELSVWVDDDLAYTRTLTGGVKKRLGVFETVQGSFSETIRVPAGKHVVRVRVSSPDEGYEQTKEIEGELVQDGRRTLDISFAGRSNDLYLAWY